MSIQFIPPRVAGPDWGEVFVPAKDCFPPTTTPRPERILHIALLSERDAQPALRQALTRLAAPGEYIEVDWKPLSDDPDGLRSAVLAAAGTLCPTLVFMQLQEPSAIDAAFVQQDLRPLCDPSCVIVNWDGDQFHEPHDVARAWFVRLGRACDTSLVCNTKHPQEYAKLGVRGAGYLQIGLNDETVFVPDFTKKDKVAGIPRVVFLGCGDERLYPERTKILRTLAYWLGPKFRAFGDNWTETDTFARPRLTPEKEAAAYQGCRIALSQSIRADLPRYTSDRLFRAMACGALVLAEKFPDTDGLGLFHGINVLFYKDIYSLDYLLRAPREWRTPPDIMRRLAADLVHGSHLWIHRMRELAAIVETIRNRKGNNA